MPTLSEVEKWRVPPEAEVNIFPYLDNKRFLVPESKVHRLSSTTFDMLVGGESNYFYQFSVSDTGDLFMVYNDGKFTVLARTRCPDTPAEAVAWCKMAYAMYGGDE